MYGSCTRIFSSLSFIFCFCCCFFFSFSRHVLAILVVLLMNFFLGFFCCFMSLREIFVSKKHSYKRIFGSPGLCVPGGFFAVARKLVDVCVVLYAATDKIVQLLELVSQIWLREFLFLDIVVKFFCNNSLKFVVFFLCWKKYL